jgi:hypothetical protein
MLHNNFNFRKSFVLNLASCCLMIATCVFLTGGASAPDENGGSGAGTNTGLCALGDCVNAGSALFYASGKTQTCVMANPDNTVDYFDTFGLPLGFAYAVPSEKRKSPQCVKVPVIHDDCRKLRYNECIQKKSCAFNGDFLTKSFLPVAGGCFKPGTPKPIPVCKQARKGHCSEARVDSISLRCVEIEPGEGHNQECGLKKKWVEPKKCSQINAVTASLASEEHGFRGYASVEKFCNHNAGFTREQGPKLEQARGNCEWNKYSERCQEAGAIRKTDDDMKRAIVDCEQITDAELCSVDEGGVAKTVIGNATKHSCIRQKWSEDKCQNAVPFEEKTFARCFAKANPKLLVDNLDKQCNATAGNCQTYSWDLDRLCLVEMTSAADKCVAAFTAETITAELDKACAKMMTWQETSAIPDGKLKAVTNAEVCGVPSEHLEHVFDICVTG